MNIMNEQDEKEFAAQRAAAASYDGMGEIKIPVQRFTWDQCDGIHRIERLREELLQLRATLNWAQSQAGEALLIAREHQHVHGNVVLPVHSNIGRTAMKGELAFDPLK